MISYPVYRLIHLISIMTLFLAFGAGAAMEKKIKWVSPIHGIALLFILIGGFGMLARLGIAGGGLPHWVIGKLVIWVLMGGALVLVKRKLLPMSVVLPLLIVLGGIAQYLAFWKPF